MMRPALLFLLRAAAATLLAVAVTAQTAPPKPLVVTGLPANAPLQVTASHDTATLQITVALKAGWHLYGRDVGGGQPVTVKVHKGAFATAGALATPMDENGLITGKAELRLPLRRTGDGDALHATMAFAVCDALECLPPIELELAPPAAAPQDKPFPVLLVAVDDGERSQRIAGFLREQGFVPTLTTYAAVTQAQCDANDIVLADSPTFGQVRGKKIDVRKFPTTRSPIVAVGFLGTQLLEAHKVTMACGYI